MSSTDRPVVGVTDLAILARCPRQLALKRSVRGARGGFRSGPALLGTATHLALEACARAWPDGEARTVATRAWLLALSEAKVEKPEQFPGAAVAKARLMGTSERLWALLDELGPGADVLPEERLVSHDARVTGRADLVIRTPESTRIVDYKTGHVLDKDGESVRLSYRLQLQIYAALEQQSTGTWPSEAILIPTRGPAIAVVIEPSECEALYEELETALDEYEDVPATQEARPEASLCCFCAHAPRCQEFWDVIDSSWQDQVLAIEGEVTALESAAIGRTTAIVDLSGGSIEGDRAVIQADEALTPALATATTGSRIRATGLRRSRGESTFLLPDSASVSIAG